MTAVIARLLGSWPAFVDRFGSLAQAAASIAPKALFGLRLWLSVCVALYLAFWLELDNAYWAATTAAIVTQPSLGASLRKCAARMMGTFVGAVAIMVLTACFEQQRTAFLVSLALWIAACGFIGASLKNAVAYAAIVAGFTAVIVAYDELGAIGGAGAGGDPFMFALTRASEICIGNIAAGLVLVVTNINTARRDISRQFAAIFADVAKSFVGTLTSSHPGGGQRPIGTRDATRRIAPFLPFSTPCSARSRSYDGTAAEYLRQGWALLRRCAPRALLPSKRGECSRRSGAVRR